MMPLDRYSLAASEIPCCQDACFTFSTVDCGSERGPGGGNDAVVIFVFTWWCDRCKQQFSVGKNPEEAKEYFKQIKEEMIQQ